MTLRGVVPLVAAVAAPAGAGVAGGVAESKITKIGNGEWVRAGTTSTYCQAWRDTGHGNAPAFDCGFWTGNVHLAGS